MPQKLPFWDGDDEGPYTAARPGPYVGPLYAPNLWDTATIKGVRVPGIVTVSVGRSRHLDVKQMPGAAPWITPIGYEPVKFSMSVRIWTPGQWDVLQDIMLFLQSLFTKSLASSTAGETAAIAALNPIIGAAAAAAAAAATQTRSIQNDSLDVFDVYHPKLAALGIRSAMCTKNGPLSDGQDRTLSLEFLQQFAKKGKVYTPKAAEQNVNGNFNAKTLSDKQVNAANGNVVNYTQTQGPQRAPSQSGVTLTPTQ